MRTALSILLAVLAGLLVSLSLVGARAEALVHTPGPVQQIAGPMSEDPAVRAALPEEVEGIVAEQLPDAVPSVLQEGLGDLVGSAVGSAADGLVADERFPAAWAHSLEQTRTDWVGRLADGDAGTVHLQLAPVVDLGVDRLAAAAETLPGGSVLAPAVREGAERIEAPLAVDLAVPDPETVPMDTLAWTVEHLYRWPWLAGTSAVLLLLALMAAPRRRRGTPLVIAGITVLALGAFSRWGLERLAPAADLEGLARVAASSLLEGIRGYALPDTVLLMVGGGIVAAVGLVTALVSGTRRGTAAER